MIDTSADPALNEAKLKSAAQEKDTNVSQFGAKNRRDITPEDRVVPSSAAEPLAESINRALALVKEGKKVLFHLESPGMRHALDAILKKVGLSELLLCLDRDLEDLNLAEDLRKTIQLGPPDLDSQKSARESRSALEHRLDRHLYSLSTSIRKTGVTGYQALSQSFDLLSTTDSQVDLKALPVREWDSTKFSAALALGQELDAFVKANGDPVHNPWRGCSDTSRTDVPGLAKVEALFDKLTVVKQGVEELFGELEITGELTEKHVSSILSCLAEIDSLDTADGSALHKVNLRAFKGWLENHEQIQEKISEQLDFYKYQRELSSRINFERLKSFDINVVARVVAEHSQKNFFTRMFHPEYDEAIAKLSKIAKVPSSVADVVLLVAHLQKVQDIQLKAIEGSAFLERFFKETPMFLDRDQCSDEYNQWRQRSQVAQKVTSIFKSCEELPEEARKRVIGLLRDPAPVYERATQIGGINSAIESYQHARDEFLREIKISSDEAKLISEADFESQSARWHAMTHGADAWNSWRKFVEISKGAKLLGMGSLISQLEKGELSNPSVAESLKSLWYGGLSKEYREARDGSFANAGYESELFTELLESDYENQRANASSVAQAHWIEIPRYSVGGQSGQMLELLADESSTSALRSVLTEAPLACQAAKPIIVVSPQSYKDLKSLSGMKFDLVVTDGTDGDTGSDSSFGSAECTFVSSPRELGAKADGALEVDPFQSKLVDILESEFGLQADLNLVTPYGVIDIAVKDPIKSGEYLFTVLTDRPCEVVSQAYAEHVLQKDRISRSVAKEAPIHAWITEWHQDYKAQLEHFKGEVSKRLSERGSSSAEPTAESVARDPLTDRHFDICKSYKRARIDPALVVEVRRGAGSGDLAKMQSLIESIVAQESPIHRDELMDRVSELLQIREGDEQGLIRGIEAMQMAIRAGSVKIRDNCIYSPETTSIQPRKRGSLKGDSARMDRLPHDEMDAAVYAVVRAAVKITSTELPEQVCNAFGYKAMPYGADKMVEESVARLVSGGLLSVTNGEIQSAPGSRLL